MFPHHSGLKLALPKPSWHGRDFKPFDVVLCSEVIEHVPHANKPVFVQQLAQLLTSDGYLILTTPRGDVWEEWKKIAPPNQPVEDWVTEQQLGRLLSDGGFRHLGLERIPIEVPSLRYFPAATPHDVRSREAPAHLSSMGLSPQRRLLPRHRWPLPSLRWSRSLCRRITALNDCVPRSKV